MSSESSVNNEFFVIANELRVLLVDDNKVNQFLGKKILHNLGINNVHFANHGSDALNCISKNNYDVILTDVEMPVMNGYELTIAIRKLSPPNNAITVIALTGNASEKEKQEALKIGMNDYLAKPYSPQDLADVLQKNFKTDKNFLIADFVASAKPHSDKLDGIHQLFNGNRKDILSLLKMLHDLLPAYMEELKRAILDSSWRNAFYAAHKLKSTIKIFGDPKLDSLIHAITELSKAESNTNDIPDLFEQLKTGLMEMMVLIGTELEK